MGDEADDLSVAVGRLGVGEAGEGGGGLEPGPFSFHLGRLATLRLRELEVKWDFGLIGTDLIGSLRISSNITRGRRPVR